MQPTGQNQGLQIFILPFQSPKANLQRLLFSPGLPKAAVSSPLLNTWCYDGFLQADWNELKMAGGLVRKWAGQRVKENFRDP